MNNFLADNETPLPAGPWGKYNSLAFDGCRFYGTLPSACKIVRFNKCFESVCEYKVCKMYQFLCYDSSEDCFWATAEGCFYRIFKLDRMFREIDSLSVTPCELSDCIITGISYCCARDVLLVSFAHCVVEVTKGINEETTILYSSGETRLTGVLCISPGYLLSYVSNGVSYIGVYNANNQQIRQIMLPMGYSIKNMVLNPCIEHRACQLRLYVLANKRGCYPYVLQFDISEDDLGFPIAECNYALCDPKCHCHDDSEVCAQVLESVAQVETALAHLLSLEGKKMQKALANSENVHDILQAGQSTNRTIVSATLLEQVLYAKLATLGEHCDFCDRLPPCPKLPCRGDGAM